MSFRDDRDALRAKNEALEATVEDQARDLQRTQRELQEQLDKDVHDEKQIERLQRRVAQLERRLGQTPATNPNAPTKTAGIAVAAALGVIVMGGVVVGILSARPKVESTYAVSEAPPPTKVAQSVGELLAEAAEPPSLPGLGAGPVVHLAHVASVSGEPPAGIAAGSGCAVLSEIDDRLELSAPVQIRCGDVTLYDGSQEMGAGFSSSEERATPISSHGHIGLQLRANDVGTRTGPRPQLTLDTRLRRARVFSEVEPLFAVTLYIEQASLDRQAALAPAEGASRRNTHLRYRRGEVTGDAPVAADAECELILEPTASGRYDCRAVLRCDGEVVYGAGTTGWNECTWRDGQMSAITDDGTSAENSDPRFIVREGEIEVGEEDWTAHFLPAPRDAAGTYAGGYLDGTPLALTFGEERLRVADGELPATITAGGTSGSVLVVAAEHMLAGHFGPGFATIGGRDAAGRPFVLYRR